MDPRLVHARHHGLLSYTMAQVLVFHGTDCSSLFQPPEHISLKVRATKAEAHPPGQTNSLLCPAHCTGHPGA